MAKNKARQKSIQLIVERSGISYRPAVCTIDSEEPLTIFSDYKFELNFNKEGDKPNAVAPVVNENEGFVKWSIRIGALYVLYTNIKTLDSLPPEDPRQPKGKKRKIYHYRVRLTDPEDNQVWRDDFCPTIIIGDLN